MRYLGANRYETMGVKRNSCVSQLMFPDMASTSSDLAYLYTDKKHSLFNQACHTPDFSYPLISSILFPSSSPMFLSRAQLYHHRKNTKWGHPSLSLHAMIMSGHWLQHTPSTAYTKYSIHQAQYTPSTSYTNYSIHWVQHTPSTTYPKCSTHGLQHLPKSVCLPFVLISTSRTLHVTSASGMPPHTINRHQPALHQCPMGKSPCHIPTVGS